MQAQRLLDASVAAQRKLGKFGPEVSNLHEVVRSVGFDVMKRLHFSSDVLAETREAASRMELGAALASFKMVLGEEPNLCGKPQSPPPCPSPGKRDDSVADTLTDDLTIEAAEKIYEQAEPQLAGAKLYVRQDWPCVIARRPHE